MPLSASQLIVLREQLDTTYSSLGRKDGTILRAINDPKGPNSASFDIDSISASQAVSVVKASEFLDLSAGGQRAWLMIVGLDRVPMKDTDMRALIEGIWTGTSTKAKLMALQSRSGSHAEVLFGQRVVMKDILAARRL